MNATLASQTRLEVYFGQALRLEQITSDLFDALMLSDTSFDPLMKKEAFVKSITNDVIIHLLIFQLLTKIKF
jgi:hypothetical protein